MAKKQAQEATKPEGVVEVRALRDSDAFGLTAGRLATVPAEALEGLVAASMVDTHPDAVAYAKSLET